jgi:hypothetical protein
MKISGAVAVLGIGMVASQIGTPYLLTTYECDTMDENAFATRNAFNRDAGLAEILPGSGACRGLPGREVLCAGLAAIHLALDAFGCIADVQKVRSPWSRCGE